MEVSERCSTGERRQIIFSRTPMCSRSSEWHTLNGYFAVLFEGGELEGQKRARIALESTFCRWTRVWVKRGVYKLDGKKVITVNMPVFCEQTF
jgi:hypothetical protein